MSPFDFTIAPLPKVIFGAGAISQLPDIAKSYPGNLLIATGARSFRQTTHWHYLTRSFRENNTTWFDIQIDDEPSPEVVDAAVNQHKNKQISAVIAIGGGSVLDAAKAIAGLLSSGRPVMDFLEVVGKGEQYQGSAIPFIAIPTTAGTGSEATKNAVLSRKGPDGFKKSFRDEQLVANIALLDPELLCSCPQPLIAANGMDAFTQLLESYVSIKANPFTDALAVSGMKMFKDSFFDVWKNPQSPNASAARAKLTYASWLSGITLAQAGLGSVHGLASPLGAYFPIPHGIVCGTLLAAATEINIRALQQRTPESPALKKYAKIGAILKEKKTSNKQQALIWLTETLSKWTDKLALAKLSEFNMQLDDIPKCLSVCRSGSMLTNPIVLEDAELTELIQRRL